MILRRQKTSPLTADELDDNFKELAEGIAAIKKLLEAKPALPEGVKSIRQAGDELYFLGTYGSDLGTVTLPKILPTPRGEWHAQEYYHLNDWVVNKNKTYACIKSHVATAFDTDQATHWRLVLDPAMKI